MNIRSVDARVVLRVTVDCDDEEDIRDMRELLVAAHRGLKHMPSHRVASLRELAHRLMKHFPAK